jgi:hypothetical protein
MRASGRIGLVPPTMPYIRKGGKIPHGGARSAKTMAEREDKYRDNCVPAVSRLFFCTGGDTEIETSRILADVDLNSIVLFRDPCSL